MNFKCTHMDKYICIYLGVSSWQEIPFLGSNVTCEIKGQCVGITGSAYVICGASGKCLAIRRKADIDYLHRYNRTVIKHYLQTILSTNGQCRSNMQTVVRAVS